MGVLEMLGLGLFGIDRMYAGSVTTGIIKLLTLGGCGVWAIVDWFAIIVNAMERKESIDSLSIKASFNKKGIKTARILGIIGVILQCVTCFICVFCCCCSLFGLAVPATGADRK